MNRTITAIALALFLAWIAPAGLRAQSLETESLDGGWTILEGYRGGKGTAMGTVTITTDGEYRRLRWSIGKETFTGIGFLEGDGLYIGWAGGESYGIALYTIRSNGILDGRWIYARSDETPGTEHAVGGSLEKKESTYTVNGINPGSGTPYNGTMSLRRTGETWQVTWQVGDDIYYGVGLVVGNRFVVGWGGDAKDFGIAAYAVESDRLVGRLGFADVAGEGTEILGRTFQASPGK